MPRLAARRSSAACAQLNTLTQPVLAGAPRVACRPAAVHACSGNSLCDSGRGHCHFSDAVATKSRAYEGPPFRCFSSSLLPLLRCDATNHIFWVDNLFAPSECESYWCGPAQIGAVRA